jgi:hypothetical protein
VRFRAENASLCLTATGTRFSSVTAEPWYRNYQFYLPLVATRMAEGRVGVIAAAGVAPLRREGGGQDVHVIRGGLAPLPSVGGGDAMAL